MKFRTFKNALYTDINSHDIYSHNKEYYHIWHDGFSIQTPTIIYFKYLYNGNVFVYVSINLSVCQISL